MKEVPWTLKPTLDLGSLEIDGTMVAFGVSPTLSVFLAFALKPLRDRKVLPGGASTALIRPPEGQDYRVLEIDGTSVLLDVTIENEPFNIHQVQPLGDQILLACARSRYGGPDDIDHNGRIYHRDGTFAGEIVLGDGIQTLQATPSGAIWTAYFDEGIFGNYGWSETLGSSGLVAWDRQGRKTFEFEPEQGLDSISDCYALNVTGEDDVWCCYYDGFPLVHLRGGQIVHHWQAPVSGSGAFAVGHGHVLFWGEYDANSRLILCRLEGAGRMRVLRTFAAMDENGVAIVPKRIAGRVDTLFVITPTHQLYRLSLTDVFAQV